MPELRFEDILINAGTDEFDRMTGYAEFPYFHKQIEVVCEEGVTAEYAAQSIRWLAEVDEALVREICFPNEPEIPVLNLSGGCDWQEDEGLHCLIKNGHVVYMGSWNDEDVWDEHLLDDDQYLHNYVLYPQRKELQQKVAERLK